MKVLVTGAGGFLGRGLVVPFEGKCDLRLMDVVDWQTPHEKLIGSVADLDTVLKAVEGVDALVLAHMASRQTGSYDTPVAPYDANVKGTANLFFAAAKFGIKRVSLISSSGVVGWYQQTGKFLARDLPPRGPGIYSHTKICQEAIAQQYHHEFGIGVAAIRPAYITDMDSAKDKYGKQAHECNWQFVDRRDIGEIARLAILLPDLGFEVFYALSTPMAVKHADMEYTYKRLNWKPKYDFSNLKQDTQ
jgi:uronate dehydrogenase